MAVGRHSRETTVLGNASAWLLGLGLMAAVCLWPPIALSASGEEPAGAEEAFAESLPKMIRLKDHYACSLLSFLPGPIPAEELLGLPSQERQAARHFNRSLNLYEDEEVAAAYREIQLALELVPDFVDAQLLRSHLAGRLWGGDAALVDTADITERFPENNWAVVTLAESYEWEGNFEEALKYFRIALRIDPDDYEALGGLARVANGLGHYEEAHEALSHAIELEPGFWEFYCLRSVVAYNLNPGVEGLEAAVADFKVSIALDPSLRLLYLDLLTALKMIEGGVELVGPHPPTARRQAGVLPSRAAPGEPPGSAGASRWSKALDPESVTDEMLAEGFVRWFKEGLPFPMM